MLRSLVASASPTSTPLIALSAAREQVLAAVAPLGSEVVEVDAALGRVLSHDLTAAADVPPFPSSAMDGYAVRAGGAGRTLTITGESRAGFPARGSVREGEAIRISTGAAVPEGATAVIAQEATTASDHAVGTREAIAEGENIRLPGEDMCSRGARGSAPWDSERWWRRARAR
jgi:molybdopterin molybdotransferase